MTMEFGLFMGGFVHRDLMANNPNAEHDRLMSDKPKHGLARGLMRGGYHE